MHTSAQDTPMWQKALVVLLTAALVLGLSPAPLLANNAYAADGEGDLVAVSLGAQDTPTVDSVKAAIDTLSNDPRDFTAADKDRVEAIQADYEALSAEDQAAIDSMSGLDHPSGDGQSYGRILEAAVWSVRSFATDTSTTLTDGTYTPESSESNKGKSDSSRTRNWWVESVTVANGQAMAKIYVTSGAATASKLASYPSVWAGGVSYEKATDNTYTIPVDLNGTTYFGGVSSSMPRPIMYELTTTIAEPVAPVELAITNNTGMFKAETATVETDEQGAKTLVMALSGSGYQILVPGTYEQAVAGGDDAANWVKGYQNAAGKWEFRIPLADGASFMPVVAVSNSYYTKYKNGQNSLERAFYPRQLEVNLEAKTLVTGDYEFSAPIAVTNNVKMFKPAAAATLETVGGPNSNNYKADLVLPMESSALDKAFVGTPAEAEAAAETIAFETEGGTEAQPGKFTIPVKWVETFGDPTTLKSLANGEPFVVSFHSAKNNSWVARTATLDEAAGTLVFDPWTDPAPANTVDELIAKIQSQVFTDTTWADCEAAKAAWDALSDAEKALVEEADYFGLDTGDASADDPLNQDGIGENEVLVVSFGTSFNGSRAATIGGVEKAIAAAYPEWSVRRAFTAQIIINHIYARDGVKIDNVEQALDRAVANGVKNLVVQPTHLMHGAEYDELVAALAPYQDKMAITVAEPLLGEVGADGTAVNDDKKAVAEAVVAAAAAPSDTALVLMGHGTSHEANVTYQQMQAQMDQLGYSNVFVGTVEGMPEGTDADSVIAKVKAAGFSKVILRPLMVVAGDHANNDMADPDDPESWYSKFTAEGNFAAEDVTCQIAGLGQIPAVQQVYVAHTAAAMAGPVVEELEEGIYELPQLSAGPSAMFNHMESAGRYLEVKGDTATIYFTEDGSTASVAKYSRLAIGKTSEILAGKDNYCPDSDLPEGTQIVEGTLRANTAENARWSFAIPLAKSEVEQLLAKDGKVYVTIWNNTGSKEQKIPGWYIPSNDIYLELGELGNKVEKMPLTEIAYDGAELKYVKEDMVSTFGMLTPDKGTLEMSLADGKVHIKYDPSNKSGVYAGFYINADITDVPAGATHPIDGFDEADWIESGITVYDFELPDSYCGFAWPIAPIKPEARHGGTTSAQYYIAIPSKDQIMAQEVAALIAALPEDVTTDEGKAAVEAARTAYDGLTEAQQALVDELPLLKAEQAVAEAEAAAAEQAAQQNPDDLQAQLDAANAKLKVAEAKLKVAEEEKAQAEAAAAAAEQAAEQIAKDACEAAGIDYNAAKTPAENAAAATSQLEDDVANAENALDQVAKDACEAAGIEYDDTKTPAENVAAAAEAQADEAAQDAYEQAAQDACKAAGIEYDDTKTPAENAAAAAKAQADKGAKEAAEQAAKAACEAAGIAYDSKKTPEQNAAAATKAQNDKVTAAEAAAKKAAADAKKAAQKTDLSKATVSVAKATYTGKALKPAVTVKLGKKTLKENTDYTVSYANNKKAGTAVAVVAGKGSYVGAVAKTFKIAKAKNTMVAKAKGKVVTVKKGKSVKKAKAFKITKAKGKVTFKKKSGNKKITVAKNGKITAKKGLKAGTYKVKVKVTAKGNANFKKLAKTVTLKVKVK